MLRDVFVLLLVAAAAKALAWQAAGLPIATATLTLGIVAGCAWRRFGARDVAFEAPLSCGMVLLGVQLVPMHLRALGPTAPLWLVGYWLTVTALFLVAVRSRLFSARVGGLLSIGMAGAGITAVRAAARSDEHVPKDAVPLATAGVLGAGAIGFLLTGAIGEWLGLPADSLSRWIGIAMPTTAEAVLVGAAHSQQAQQQTAAWRMLVNLLQFVPILVYLQVFVPADERPDGNRVLRAAVASLRRIPLFVWGLTAVGAFAWAESFTEHERDVLRALTNWSFLLALAGIGMQTSPRAVLALGPRRLLAVLAIWCGATAALLGMILWLRGR